MRLSVTVQAPIFDEQLPGKGKSSDGGSENVVASACNVLLGLVTFTVTVTTLPGTVHSSGLIFETIVSIIGPLPFAKQDPWPDPVSVVLPILMFAAPYMSIKRCNSSMSWGKS